MNTTPDHPIEDAAATKPTPNLAVRCFLPDGTTAAGVWTGRVWLARGAVVEPVSWQYMPERSMTVTWTR